MTENQSTTEREVLDELERSLSMEGYRLVREPRADELPLFLKGFRPDAIAVGKEPNIVIQVITRQHSDRVKSTRLSQLQAALAAQPNWKLQVVYTSPSRPLPAVASTEEIRARVQQIRELALTDRAAGLVMGWSILEAAARSTLPDRATAALTPASTVELLASLGYITQSEAARLREIGRVRNLVVHGDVTVNVTAEKLDSVFAAIDAVLDASETSDSSS